jgi:hypothetical protein
MSFRTAAQTAPAQVWKAVTPDDVNDLPAGCRGIYVNVTGNISLTDQSGNTLPFSNVAANTVLPLAVRRINATGTTATVYALY